MALLVALSRVDSNVKLPIELFDHLARLAFDDDEQSKFYILMTEFVLQG